MEEIPSKGRIAKWVVWGLLFLVTITAFGLGWRWIVAEPEGIVQQREQTRGSGSYRIAAYERFYDLCASVQGMEAQLVALRTELEETTDGKRAIQVRASITGLEGQRARTIAQYNADARKEGTLGQFRDSGLPYQLDVQEEDTVCEVS